MHFYTIVFSVLLLGQISQIAAKSIIISSPYLPENVEQNGTEGREIKIISAVINCMGYQAKIEVFPYLRHLKIFKENARFDAVSTVPVGHKIKAHKTKAHVFYHNGGIVRADSKMELNSKEDMKSKHVIAFRGANELLPGLKEIIPGLKSYKETTEQFNHNKMLMRKRVDVVLSDGLIFMAHQRRLFPKKIDHVVFKPLFKPIPFFMAFKRPELKDSFNKCYEQLKAKNVIRKINQSFINKYKKSLQNGYLGL